MELASHGYICLAADTHDGSCQYTCTEKGYPILFDTTGKFYDVDLRKHQLRRRVDHVKLFVDELQSPDYLKRKTGLDLQVDFDKLIVGGHSFGGITCLGVAAED